MIDQEAFKWLDENQLAALDDKLQFIQENLSQSLQVTIHYFEKDSKKEGGEYKMISGIIKRIDDYERVIILQDKTRIRINTIIQIDCELFHEF